jgi:hypothetical protein
MLSLSTVLTKNSSALIQRRGTQRESGSLSPLRTSATSAVEPKIDNFVNTIPGFCLTAILLIAPVSALSQSPAPKPKPDKQSEQAPGGKQQPQPPKPPARPPRTETFWEKVLRISGISVTPSAMKGDEDGLTGDVHVLDLTVKTSRRLTFNGGYRSPIFLPGETSLLALKGEDVVELPFDGGAEKKRYTINGVVKLVGVSQDGTQVLYLSRDREGQLTVWLLALSDGQETKLAYNPESVEDKMLLARLSGWERVYDGGRITLYTQLESKEASNGKLEWREVYLKRDSQQVEPITRCDGVNCGNPTLSQNWRYMAFIKASG